MLASNCTEWMLNRISSVKWQKKENKSPSISSLLYPSMMSANMIAIWANTMFNRPESNFQPVDLINEINNKSFWKWIYNFSTIKKKETFIPALNWIKGMSRSRLENWVIDVLSINFDYIVEKLEVSLYNNSWDKLYVIKNIWKVVFNWEEFPNNFLIKDIINILANKIISTLEFSNWKSDISYNSLYDVSNYRIDKAIKMIWNKKSWPK
jgi:hypothetical protein